MKLEIKDEKKNIELQVGDVVVIKALSSMNYLITEDGFSSFTARAFNGESTATGIHSSLEALEKSLNKYDCIHFSKKEYKLQIVKI